MLGSGYQQNKGIVQKKFFEKEGMGFKIRRNPVYSRTGNWYIHDVVIHFVI